jgi:hypothetical protein
MRLLCPIVRVLSCVVDNIRHQLWMCHTVASKFVRHYLSGLATITPYKPFEEALCCSAISAGLQIDIYDFSILIHSPPQILLLAIDFHEDLIDVECIAITTMSPFESTSVSSTKLDTPESDGFVADGDASFCEQIFNITVA